MTPDEFRKAALSLPEATEGAHMGHPDFRVRGKIFATLWADGVWGMVKLTPAHQAVYVGSEPGAFEAVNGAWGRRGATKVRLASASKRSVAAALAAAWENVAPKRLPDPREDRSQPSARPKHARTTRRPATKRTGRGPSKKTRGR